ncbi:MAG: SNF2-related protein, partial [Pseudomonadota bacterium]|nr:SNF2-related protein [Pseudomonadota bacterium]
MKKGLCENNNNNNNNNNNRYAILRKDVRKLESIDWNYVVLDEGHRIRNPKTAVSKAAFRMNASRRVVLSGTPLQNATSDVWSIFRFLAPGYF